MDKKRKTHKIIYFTAIAILSLALFSLPVFSQETVQKAAGGVAVFIVPGRSGELKSLNITSFQKISKTFQQCGRFIPIDTAKANNALLKAIQQKKKDIYKSAAVSMNADIYVVISVQRRMQNLYGRMIVEPVNGKYRNLKRSITVKSKIPMNIPLKLAREIAFLHNGIPLKAQILQKRKDIFILNIGQWHNIKPGRYDTVKGNTITILKTGRYNSLARGSSDIQTEKIIYINAEENVSRTVSNIEKSMKHNTIFTYNLKNKKLKNQDPERRMIEAMCVINIGANACVPGYGAYLATGHLGVGDKSPSVSGILISTGLIFTQLTLTEFMTEFKSNFFPWKRDNDKSENVQNLQIFLWATLPATFSVSYLDQLAHQFRESEVLPPFFEDADNAAVVFSFLFPGGGLFYKGRRLAGWGYYCTEMFLAGFGVYNLNSPTRSLAAFISLGVVKIIELFNAYFIGSDYDFFNYEMERENSLPSISFGMYNTGDYASRGDTIYTATAVIRF